MHDVMERSAIERLAVEMAALPQPVLPPTEHYFAGGMYARKMRLPAGTLIVGKRHKHDHFFVLCSGTMDVADETGTHRLESGAVVCAKAGTKRALFCITECIGMNVHLAATTDLDELEKLLVEDDPLARFDARNNLKPEALSCS